MAKNTERSDWVEHLGKAFESLARDLKNVLPEETYRHLRASRKELLLAIRSVIDREVQRMEKEEKRKPRKVQVK